ncbi:unnamed protein product [Adineta ricciae]|uniref:Tyrosine-protein kinase ephrin type A/B receptor-like domain-containing protein n=2 Tax=Adineta ricciae TaxID=249248 RepID=A0A815T5T5_ADIRI|nr:unnamed protein product [Adineta ricciae]
MEIVILLLLILKWQILAMRYESKEDIHDLRVALNDQFIIAASNVQKTYIIHSISNIISNSSCIINNPYRELNIHGISILTMNQNNLVSFVQLAENITSMSTIISQITLNLTKCNNTLKRRKSFHHTIVWDNERQEHMFLKIDPQQKFAYVFADSFILSYDLLNNQIDQINRTNSIIFGNSYGSFTPYAFDLKNDWAAVAGFHIIQNNSRSKQCVYIFGLQPLRVINVSSIGLNDMQEFDRISFNHDYDMSLAINPSGTTLAIGEVQLNRVTIAHIDGNEEVRFISNFIQMSEFDVWNGFGRSVLWLEDDETLAILVLKSSSYNSSQSEIQIYKNVDRNRSPGSIIPSFIIPNNQQTLDGIHRWTSSLKLTFRHIRIHSNNILIQLSNGHIVYIPSSNAGFCSRQLLSNNARNFHVLQSKPCVSGTYKNISGPGPCTICPSGTKNNGTRPSIQCQPCKTTAFCPLGASDEVNLTHFRSHIQTFSYPDTPNIDDYDDLLLLNFFPTNLKLTCLVLTPLFWTIVATVLCLLMWFIMFFIKRRRLTSIDSYRQRVKIFFKHNDLIGEGERWIGGLASVVIFAIIIYSTIFAYFYLHSYPLETREAVNKKCDNNQRNSKFDNALQLPLPEPDGTYWKIFDMLNKQPFTMTVHLINTRAQCNDITVARNRHTGAPLSIVEKNCTLSPNNVSGSFSFDLPSHTSSVRIDINGPYFIGALRLCLYGKSNIINEDSIVHRLRELDICTLFYTNNQTIGLSTAFVVRLIKVINVTRPLARDDKTFYDGIWAPFITYMDTLSDELYFAEKGEYLRYESKKTNLDIQFAEEIYFVQNNQSPIIRRGALFFHTILFSFSLIEIVAMIFLLYKLWFRPIHQDIRPSHHDLVVNEFRTSQTQISSNLSSHLLQSHKQRTLHTNDDEPEDQQQVKINQNVHNWRCTKNSIRRPIALRIEESWDNPLSSSHPLTVSVDVSFNHLPSQHSSV